MGFFSKASRIPSTERSRGTSNAQFTCSTTAEALERLLVVGHVFWKEFESDKAVEPGVLGLINDAHPTAAKAFKDAGSGKKFGR